MVANYIIISTIIDQFAIVSKINAISCRICVYLLLNLRVICAKSVSDRAFCLAGPGSRDFKLIDIIDLITIIRLIIRPFLSRESAGFLILIAQSSFAWFDFLKCADCFVDKQSRPTDYNIITDLITIMSLTLFFTNLLLITKNTVAKFDCLIRPSCLLGYLTFTYTSTEPYEYTCMTTFPEACLININDFTANNMARDSSMDTTRLQLSDKTFKLFSQNFVLANFVSEILLKLCQIFRKEKNFFS